MNVYTAAQMREFDRSAIDDCGIAGLVLMENAALRVIEFLEAKFTPLREKRVVILCGKGNNGGDGLAIARLLEPLLKDDGLCVLMPDESQMSGDARINARIWQKSDCCTGSGHRFYHSWLWSDWENTAHQARIIQSVSGADIVVDALFGTGFRGELLAPFSQLLFLSRSSGAAIVAVDICSGVSADSGEAAPEVRADFTISFAAPKIGFFARQGLEKSGEIWIGEVGTVRTVRAKTPTDAQILGMEAARNLLPERAPDAHKGEAGRVLVVGGALGMSGAIALAAKSALRVGAGLCLSAIPEKIMAPFASSVLEATSVALPCDEAGAILEIGAQKLGDLWPNADVVALGPGLSRGEGAQRFARSAAMECPVPLIIDADALHALPPVAAEIQARKAATILTPHAGEMGVLLGISAREVNENRFEVVRRCAQKYGAWVVLKGARSLIAEPEGALWVNLSGNAGMATGGSGDVLTGAIAGLLAQTKNVENATLLGVYVHGVAGDLAQLKNGNGLVAGDICAFLGEALVQVSQRQPQKINGRLQKLE